MPLQRLPGCVTHHELAGQEWTELAHTHIRSLTGILIHRIHIKSNKCAFGLYVQLLALLNIAVYSTKPVKDIQ